MHVEPRRHRRAGGGSLTDGGRRALFKHGGLVALLVGCGLVGIREAHAAMDASFDSTLMVDVLRALGGTPASSTAIDLDIPDLTENGAMVPIVVTSRLPRTEQILIIAEKNPFPLVARFDVPPGTEPYISTRVKLADTGTVWGIVKAGGRLYSTSRETAVTLGGCGG